MPSRLLDALLRLTRAQPHVRKRLLGVDVNHGRELLRAIALQTGGWVGWEATTMRAVADALAFVPLSERGLRVAGDIEIAALISHAFDRMVNAGEVSPEFAALGRHRGFRTALKDSILELRVAGVNADALRAGAATGSPTAQLVPVLAEYELLLASGGVVDPAGVFLVALEHFDAESPFVLDGITALVPTLSTRGIAGQLVRRLVDAGAVLLDIDCAIHHGTANEPQVPTLLASIDRAFARSALGWSLAAEVPAPDDPRFDASLVMVDIFAAATPSEELREVCRRVMAEGLRWDQVEVVATDPDAYGIALDALAQQIDMGVTMLKGIPLVRTRLGRALERWFTWLEDGLPADVLRQALEAGEIAIADDLYSGDAADLARHLRAERIGWGRARYQAFIDRVDAMPGERVADPDDGESPEESNEFEIRKEHHRGALARLLRRLLFITPDVPERGAADSIRTSAADLARHTLEFLEMVPVSVGAEQQTKERLTRRLDFLAGVDDEDIEFSLAMLALRDGLSDLRSWPPTDDTRKPYRAGGGMLHLTDIAHAGATARPRTFIVGLDAERVGGGARQDPLIPDAARRAFGDGLLPDVNARRAAWTESLGVALSSLRGRVTLSYAIRGGAEGRDCGPSPLLLQVYRINSGDGKLTFEELRAALSPPACAVPHTNVDGAGIALDARDVWLQAIAGDALMLDADAAVRDAFPMLAAGLDAHAVHDGDVLSACHGLVPEAGPVLDPTRADAPYLSPSALEQIGKCPLQWFYRKGLGIRAERDPEFDADAWLDALERGSLLHKVFETFVLAYQGRQSDVLLPEAETVLRDMTTAVIDEWRVHEPPPSESVCAAESAELHRAARAFLQMERDAVARGEPAAWEATEFPFGATSPAQYALVDGRRIRLRGVADRIDRMGDGTLRIVDYKTGNPKKYRPGGKRGPYDGGRLLQPSLYADAIEAERGSAVSAFEYRFPTDKGGNAIIAYPVESLGAAREVITALVDHVSQGRFLPTTDASDCRHCDHAPICRVSVSDFSTDSPRAEWAARVAASMPEYQSMLARRGKPSGGDAE